MAITTIRGQQVLNGSIQRADLDTSTVGQAVISKILQGTGITLSSTGGDAGTGDVTISVSGGGAGTPGVNAYTQTSSQFTVPPVGSTVVVTVANASWLTVGQEVAIQTAGGNPTTAGTLQVQSITGNQVTLLNPAIPAVALANTSAAGLLCQLSGASTDYVGGDNATHGLAAAVVSTVGLASATKAGLLAQVSGNSTDYAGGDNACHGLAGAVRTNVGLASPSQSGLLVQVSGSTSDYVGGDNACHGLVAAIQPTIWSARLRSFNALGNPNFEVDQRTQFAGVTATGFALDRWSATLPSATFAASFKSLNTELVVVPNSNFNISQNFLRITVTTPKASLGANDIFSISQSIEGPIIRELLSDVSSISLLVRSSVAGVTFGAALRDGGTTRTLAKLCTISAANTWTLISLPNLPSFASSGTTFYTAPGGVGYFLNITLGAGSFGIPSSNDTWIPGSYVGANGQSNFAGQAANSTFDIGFVQHEPGAICTTLIDKPFMQNFDECLRYYQKSYDYAVAANTVTTVGQAGGVSIGTTVNIRPGTILPKRMAKDPTVTVYSTGGGAANTVLNITAGAGNVAVLVTTGESGYYLNASAAPAGSSTWQWQHVADTGW